jgi:MFS family permease
MTAEPAIVRGLPRNVVALGTVSLFMGMSSTMILGLLPAFIVKILGASVLWVGTIEGAAESTASITKVFSGALSDRIRRRKALVVAGYGLSACVKLLFPLSYNVTDVLVARVFDRVGKGIRDAPRDALLADMTLKAQRGSSFGLRHALFSIGAVIGPLTAVGLMMLTHDNFRLVYGIALIPAFISVAVLVRRVEERRPSAPLPEARERFSPGKLIRLPTAFWRIAAFAAAVALARFSQAFLLLKAVSVGIDPGFVPMMLVLINAVYSATSYPLGLLADRIDRRLVLGGGILVLILAELLMALAATPVAVAAGAALWGLQMGTLQGLFGAVIADIVPEEQRGTAFGVYDLIIGIVALVSSILAGALWVVGGPVATFAAGSIVAGTALVILIKQRRDPSALGQIEA